MKFNIVQTLIAIGVSGLIAYGFYSFHDSENKLLLCSGSFIFLSLTLIPTIGMSFVLPRTTTVIKTVAGIFFAIGFTNNLIFSFFNFSTPSYIMTTCILLLLYLLIAYSIHRARQ